MYSLSLTRKSMGRRLPQKAKVRYVAWRKRGRIPCVTCVHHARGALVFLLKQIIDKAGNLPIHKI